MPVQSASQLAAAESAAGLNAGQKAAVSSGTVYQAPAAAAPAPAPAPAPVAMGATAASPYNAPVSSPTLPQQAQSQATVPAPQVATVAPATPQNNAVANLSTGINSYGLTPSSSTWYNLQPGETIANYNARIAAANSNLSAPGTTSSTGVTNTAGTSNTTVGGATSTPQTPLLPGLGGAPVSTGTSPLSSGSLSLNGAAPTTVGGASTLPALASTTAGATGTAAPSATTGATGTPAVTGNTAEQGYINQLLTLQGQYAPQQQAAAAQVQTYADQVAALQAQAAQIGQQSAALQPGISALQSQSAQAGINLQNQLAALNGGTYMAQQLATGREAIMQQTTAAIQGGLAGQITAIEGNQAALGQQQTALGQQATAVGTEETAAANYLGSLQTAFNQESSAVGSAITAAGQTTSLGLGQYAQSNLTGQPVGSGVTGAVATSNVAYIAGQNQALSGSYATQASTAQTALGIIQSTVTTAQNIISGSTIGSAGLAWQNTGILSYLQQVEPDLAGSYENAMNEIQTQATNLVGSGVSMTPTEATTLAANVNPANLTSAQLNVYLTNLQAVANNRIVELQQQSAAALAANSAPGGPVLYAGPVATTTATAGSTANPQYSAITSSPGAEAVAGTALSTLGSVSSAVPLLTNALGAVTGL